ncbi:MBL fold metallo-hydrolase [Pelagimonas varians]|uniref:Beta-lactamase n=1 Tax=Pelagimonas varians TaxID=696760 RepID=A0A238JVQ3_9RHOB|nr:MBL fold metallo-hydrolase [Pelagimonas varians]PYG34485.1 glyoxylase-like metal-dependent hydrolase (beta-lactamase superfamily II) [Pelagimonas varians]SMX33902.1 Beta-lactamase precursor [Pelagimonas varians]
MFRTAFAMVFAGTAAFASEDIADKYPQSELYDKPVQVIPGVYSAIGATAPPTYENAGHNNNLSFIVTGDGVVVINGGASVRLAAALHEEIKAVTDQPVKLVINENGQGHAMLGNAYWTDLGVDVLAHADAIHEMVERGDFILQGMQRYNKDKAEGTRAVPANLSFDDRYVIEMGGLTIEALHLGPAHDPGDVQVWIPSKGIVIAGDIAFHERMPPIFPETDTSAWIETFEGPFAGLGATYVIPGHGHPTNMAMVTMGTVDYLHDLREKIGAHIDAGGDLAGAYYVDQDRWKHLDTFEELATKNAGRVFEQMEWE